MSALFHCNALLTKDRFAEAKQVALDGLAQDPTDAYLLSALAQAMLGLNDPVQGYGFMTDAVALAPDDAELLADFGLFQLEVNRRKDAVETLEQARSIDPDNRYVLLLSIAVTLTDPRLKTPVVRDKVLREARAFADSALRSHPNSASVHIADGQVYLAAKNPQAAEASARTALSIDPSNARALTLLGTTLEKQGRTHDAGEMYIHAARSDPTSDHPLEHLREVSAGRLVLLGIVLFVLFGLLGLVAGPSVIVVPVIMICAIGGIVVLGDLFSKRSQKRAASKRLNPDAQAILDQDRKLR